MAKTVYVAFYFYAEYSKLLSEETLGSESDSDAARDGSEGGAGGHQQSASKNQVKYDSTNV